MTLPVCRSVGRLVCLPVCHNFIGALVSHSLSLPLVTFCYNLEYGLRPRGYYDKDLLRQDVTPFHNFLIDIGCRASL